jgi:pterin-4a-carbinolamine dehydratase
MADDRHPLVFISYRRIDSAPAARLLSADLRTIFGLGSVFIDTNDIRIGTDWPARIDERLQAASVLIVVIGPSWLRAADEAGRRRLDKQDDWVRNEIAHAIDNKLVLIPFLVGGASFPSKDALPKRIIKLAKHQTIKVDYESWDNDLNPLIKVLEDEGFQKAGSAAPVRLPDPPGVNPKSLTESEIENALKRLPGWQLTSSYIPGKEPNKRIELMRTYEFASFEDAIDFMAEAAKHISIVEHHPRWENTWRTVRVWLTTWDIGHKPSQYDLELAEYLNNLFGKYPVPKGKK